jgi:hypothetical protein
MEPYVSDPQTRRKKMECKPELVISSLQRFYAHQPDIEKVLQYLNGEAPLSLRIIDWFVTKYSRKAFVRYTLHGQEFLVYNNYKSQLKAYSKKLFDPFCRRERISFQIPGHEAFLTTVGKLNFFRWAIEKGILDKNDNPLKNAPHTAMMSLSSDWKYSYTREKAVFPSDESKQFKFWPAVARIDNVYGDRNLVCSCEPLESYL